MSLPYFAENNWQAEVVMVHEKFSDVNKDLLLLESVPPSIKIHKVAAFSKKWTTKMGLGSLGIRSMFFYRAYVNRLLKRQKFDLIYFSTTEFMVTLLGSYWKRKFKVPFVIDMQDPWHSTYYQDKPKHERPKKYWFSYRMHRYSEPLAMKNVDGLISVSQAYIDTLKVRYPVISQIPAATITFGAFQKDFEIANSNSLSQHPPFKPDHINIAYIGRAGYDMQKAIRLLFESFKSGLQQEKTIFEKIRFHFIGTSYAKRGTGIPTVFPLANEYGIANYVAEYTDRIGFYDSLNFLQKANALFIPGSDDPQYTASKIYPYILAQKPLLAIFNEKSNAYQILKNCNAGTVISLNSPIRPNQAIYDFLQQTALHSNDQQQPNWTAFEQYTAAAITKKQSELFDQVIEITRLHGF